MRRPTPTAAGTVNDDDEFAWRVMYVPCCAFRLSLSKHEEEEKGR